MKKTLLLTALIALTGASIASAQCCGAAAKKTETAKIQTCTKCGEVKGTEACCKKDVASCAACGLHAGSPGCKAACKK